MKKTEYINEINNLLNLADVEILDFVYQFLQKGVDTTLQINPLTEQPQPA